MPNRLPNTNSSRRIEANKLPDNLLTFQELASLCWEHLRVKITPSKLCTMRADGLPYVRVSRRGYRYQYESAALWILNNARRRTVAANSGFGEVPNTRPLETRTELRRVSGEGV